MPGGMSRVYQQICKNFILTLLHVCTYLVRPSTPDLAAQLGTTNPEPVSVYVADIDKKFAPATSKNEEDSTEWIQTTILPAWKWNASDIRQLSLFGLDASHSLRGVKGVIQHTSLPSWMAGGPHFAGNCNLESFPQNAGLECRKSAHMSQWLQNFPGKHSPGPPPAAKHLQCLHTDVTFWHIQASPSPNKRAATGL